MKKYFHILSSWLLVFSMFLGTLCLDGLHTHVHAEDEVTIGVNSLTAMPGDEINVEVYIENNPGMMSMLFDIIFDDSVFTLTKVTDAKQFGSANHDPNFTGKSPYALNWANDLVSENYTYNGVLVTLTFKVSETAALKDYKFDLSYDIENGYAFYDSEFIEYNPTLIAGTVTLGEAAHVHATTKVEAKEATCTEDGNIEYYTCECGAYFEDAAATVEITKEATVIAAEGHDNKVEFDADNHWEVCSKCNEVANKEAHKFSNWTIVKEATEETTGLKERECACGHKEVAEVPVLIHTHAIVKTDAKAPTHFEAGNIEYYTCTKCGSIFKDAQGKNEITLKETVIEKVAHTFDEVKFDENGHWTVCECGTTTDVVAHVYGNPVVTVKPTCTETGKQVSTCECGHEKEEVVKALGHNVTKVEATEATCTEEGNIEYYVCEACDELFADAKATTTITKAETVIKATGHDFEGKFDAVNHWEVCTKCDEIQNKEAHKYSDWTVVKAPTEETKGLKVRECACGHKQEEEIAVLPHTHKMSKTEAKEATHFEAGNIEYYTCTKCNQIFKDAAGQQLITLEETVIEKVAHTFDEVKFDENGHWTVCECGTTTDVVAHVYGNPVVTVKPTCTETGKQVSTCECGHEKEEVVKALGHNVTKVEATEATCTDEGNIEYYVCEACDKLFADAKATTTITKAETVIKATGHDFVGKFDAENHWEACTKCNEIQNKEAHKFSDWTVVKEATEESTGLKVRECACGHKQEEVIAVLPHTHVMTKTEAKDATHFEAGNIEYYTCTKCNQIFKDAAGQQLITLEETVIEKVAHTFDEVKFDENGHWTVCECGTTTDVVAHVYGNPVVTVKPTCTETGKQTVTCECGHEKEEIVAALGHDFNKVTANAPTCTEAGNKEYYECLACGKLFADKQATEEITIDETIIPATGHEFVGQFDAHNHWEACKKCNEIKNKEAHKFSDWTVVKEATEESTGLKVRECACGHEEEEVIAVLPHTHVMTKTEAKEATHFEAGNIEYYTCTKCKAIFADEAGTKAITLKDTVIEVIPHAYEEVEFDANGHWHVCECGETTEVEAHVYGDPIVVVEPTLEANGIASYGCTKCSHTKTEEIVFVNEVVSNSGVTVTIPEGSSALIDSITELVVEIIEKEHNKEVVEEIKSIISDRAEVINVYDITLKRNGLEVKVDGTIVITLPVEAFINTYESLSIVYVDAEGKVTTVETTLNADNTLSFTVDSLEDFTLVGVTKEESKPEHDPESPSTGDYSNMSLYMAILTLSSLAIVVLLNKKRSLAK